MDAAEESDKSKQESSHTPSPPDLLSSQQPRGAAVRYLPSSSAHALQLPLARVKATIKSDPDVTLTSQEAAILIAKATELLIGHIVRQAYTFTVQGKRKTVQRRDIDAAIPRHDELAFLEGTLDS